MKKKLLIVGGSGFIGHNLALKLNKDFDITIIDSFNVNNLLTFQSDVVKNKFLFRKILNNRLDLLEKLNIKLKILDARNHDELSKAVSDCKPDVLLHLAAVSHSNESNKTPHNTFDNSLRTLENSLDCIKHNNIHLIYLSSSMVYGNFEGRNVKEDDILKPIGIYGSLKHAGELIIKSYNEVFNTPYTIIRPSALYGERCVSRRVSQIFIENALTDKEISIKGDGNEKLDFTYIDDLVNGIKNCINNENSINQTFNITYGNGRKINELVYILREYFPDLKVSYGDKDKFMPERGTLDISKAKKLIDYSPTYPLEVGFKKNIEWYIDFFKTINN